MDSFDDSDPRCEFDGPHIKEIREYKEEMEIIRAKKLHKDTEFGGLKSKVSSSKSCGVAVSYEERDFLEKYGDALIVQKIRMEQNCFSGSNLGGSTISGDNGGVESTHPDKENGDVVNAKSGRQSVKIMLACPNSNWAEKRSQSHRINDVGSPNGNSVDLVGIPNCDISLLDDIVGG